MSSIVRPRLLLACAGIAFASIIPFTHRVSAESAEASIKPQMGILRDGLKAIAKDLADPTKFEAALATVLKMQEAAQLAKTREPPATAKRAEDARDAFVKDCRKTMITLQKHLLDLEVALLEGDSIKAKDSARQAAAVRNLGHDTFNSK